MLNPVERWQQFQVEACRNRDAALFKNPVGDFELIDRSLNREQGFRRWDAGLQLSVMSGLDKVIATGCVDHFVQQKSVVADQQRSMSNGQVR